jgi:anti-anti-sigma factor
MSADSALPHARLSVTAQPDIDAMRPVMAGEIDMSTTEHLGRSLSSALDQRRPAVVVDLADVTFIDSTGIAELVRARNRALADNTSLTVINCQSIVRRVLEVTGMLAPLSGEES